MMENGRLIDHWYYRADNFIVSGNDVNFPRYKGKSENIPKEIKGFFDQFEPDYSLTSIVISMAEAGRKPCPEPAH